jgi:hypothetical protein
MPAPRWCLLFLAVVACSDDPPTTGPIQPPPLPDRPGIDPRLSFDGKSFIGTVGGDLPVSVRLRDRFGDPIVGVQVELALEGPLRAFPGDVPPPSLVAPTVTPARGRTDRNGELPVQLRLGSVAANYRLTAIVRDSVSGNPVPEHFRSIYADAGRWTRAELATSELSLIVGDATDLQWRVRFTDQWGNETSGGVVGFALQREGDPVPTTERRNTEFVATEPFDGWVHFWVDGVKQEHLVQRFVVAPR